MQGLRLGGSLLWAMNAWTICIDLFEHTPHLAGLHLAGSALGWPAVYLLGFVRQRCAIEAPVLSMDYAVHSRLEPVMH